MLLRSSPGGGSPTSPVSVSPGSVQRANPSQIQRDREESPPGSQAEPSEIRRTRRFQVVGQSMIDTAILEGDIVTVRRQDTANHSDMVASLGQECGATRSRRDRCSSAAMRTTIARATGVVLSLDRANQRQHASGGTPRPQR
ncbi:S24 family peptidase [Streptomyces sp. 21So2-11]|uniref:LexA family protein n=1 Tax=Streptomyces sp. 21So2-11 TaxID=3144408 RepID=UPI00321AFA7F